MVITRNTRGEEHNARPMRIHRTHENDRSYDDGATNVTGIQTLIEQMYQIIKEKSLLKNRLCGGHEPIFRDTKTGRLRLIVNGSRIGEL